jgi:hypothetical protein
MSETVMLASYGGRRIFVGFGLGRLTVDLG